MQNAQHFLDGSDKAKFEKVWFSMKWHNLEEKSETTKKYLFFPDFITTNIVE